MVGLAPTGPCALGQEPGFHPGATGVPQEGCRTGGGAHHEIAKWLRACQKLRADPEVGSGGRGCQGILLRGKDFCTLVWRAPKQQVPGPRVVFGNNRTSAVLEMQDCQVWEVRKSAGER